jgi:hypothetical protein
MLSLSGYKNGKVEQQKQTIINESDVYFYDYKNYGSSIKGKLEIKKVEFLSKDEIPNGIYNQFRINDYSKSILSIGGKFPHIIIEVTNLDTKSAWTGFLADIISDEGWIVSNKNAMSGELYSLLELIDGNPIPTHAASYESYKSHHFLLSPNEKRTYETYWMPVRPNANNANLIIDALSDGKTRIYRKWEVSFQNLTFK